MVEEHECPLNLHFGESANEADRIRQKVWESLCQYLYITEQIKAKLPKNQATAIQTTEK